MTKVFQDQKAKRRFVELYEKLSEPLKSDFGRAIREAADRKVTDLERTEEFYLTEIEVIEIYEGLDVNRGGL